MAKEDKTTPEATPENQVIQDKVTVPEKSISEGAEASFPSYKLPSFEYEMYDEDGNPYVKRFFKFKPLSGDHAFALLRIIAASSQGMLMLQRGGILQDTNNILLAILATTTQAEGKVKDFMASAVIYSDYKDDGETLGEIHQLDGKDFNNPDIVPLGCLIDLIQGLIEHPHFREAIKKARGLMNSPVFKTLISIEEKEAKKAQSQEANS